MSYTSSAQPQRVYKGQPPTGAATSVFTVPSGQYARLTEILLCNTTATAASATVHIVSVGDTASAANMIVAALIVPANTTTAVTLATYLTPGERVFVAQGTAAAITATISGDVFG